MKRGTKSRVKETGKYMYRTARAIIRKKDHIPDLILIPSKSSKKKGYEEMHLKFIKYSKKNNTLTFKITKRDHIKL